MIYLGRCFCTLQVDTAMVVLQDTFRALVLAQFNTTIAQWKQVVTAMVVLQDTFQSTNLGTV